MSLQLVKSIFTDTSCAETLHFPESCKGTGQSILIADGSIILKYEPHKKKYTKIMQLDSEKHGKIIVVKKSLFIFPGGRYFFVKKSKLQWSKIKLKNWISPDCIGVTSHKSKPFIHLLSELCHIRINPRNYRSKTVTKCEMPYIKHASLIEYNGSFYIFGGTRFAGTRKTYYDSVHCYEYKTAHNQPWIKNAGRLPEPRACHTTVRYHQYAIIIGGHYNNSHCQYDDILMYDLETHQTVRQLQVLPYRITDGTATLINNEIHHFGGRAYENGKYLKKYDWQETNYVEIWEGHIVVMLHDVNALLVSGYIRLCFDRNVPLDLTVSITKYYK